MGIIPSQATRESRYYCHAFRAPPSDLPPLLGKFGPELNYGVVGGLFLVRPIRPAFYFVFLTYTFSTEDPSHKALPFWQDISLDYRGLHGEW
jgi:hypothetical protein